MSTYFFGDPIDGTILDKKPEIISFFITKPKKAIKIFNEYYSDNQ